VNALPSFFVPIGEDQHLFDNFTSVNTELMVRRVFELELPINAIGMRCSAPWSNSSDFMFAEQRFETRRKEML
jgi:hypothetical protein